VIAVHLEAGRATVRSEPRPRRKRGHALLRLRLAGICNTDLELQRGYYGFAGRPGHEFVADVVESADPEWAGRRVVGDINLACGRCGFCARSLARHCVRRTVLGIVRHPGAFAEYLTLPEANLHSVPSSMPDEVAVFAEPVAAACEILEQVDIPAGVEVAVLGDGKLGLLAAQVLAARGATVHLYGRHRDKLRIAEAAGVEGRLVKRLPAKAYEFTVEATGSAGGLEAAVGMTRPRGTVVVKSTVHGRVAFDTARLVVDEITLVGSRCGRFAPALGLLESGKLNVVPMISAEYRLADAAAAFEHAARRGTLKVLLRP
jgi:alcohol dehydrogenase